jgi:ABC-type dipeptide/oligopeptide/nickel transport system permease component
MLGLLARRIGSSLIAIFGASVISFVILRVLPGDPARLVLGQFATAGAVRQETIRMGLNQPLYTQYYRFVRDFVRGDWGFAYSVGQPVRTQFASRLPATVELALTAFVFAFAGATMLALLATYRRRRILDAVVRAISFFGLGTPAFWFGLLLLMLFFSSLGWLPGPDGRLSTGATPPPPVTHFFLIDSLVAGQFRTFWDALRHIILPAAALGLSPFAFMTRLLRTNLLEVSREPFLVVARGKGLGRWAAFVRHALPNAFLPTLTAAGLILAELLTGSVLVEKVFNWPGIGALVADSILRQDYAVVQTFILLSAIAYIVVNFVVDLLYGVIDPRTRIAPLAGTL